MSRISTGCARASLQLDLPGAGILAAIAAFALLGPPAHSDAQEVSGSSAYPGTSTPAQRNQALEQGDGEVHVQLVRQGDLYPVPEPSIYMLVGAGGNITLQVGSDGVLLVNTGKAAMSAKVLAAIHSITAAPLRTIINTDGDGDDSGGNEALAATGAAVNGGDVTNLIGTGAGVTTIIAAQEVLDRMSAAAGKDLQPRGARPNDTYDLPVKDMWFDGESIRIIHQRSAHTDGDSIVYFRHSDAVSAGNIYSTTGYPQFDLDRGGSIQGVIDGLNRLVYELMIPASQNDGGTLVIPNHGYLSSFSDVVFYQEMVIIIRDRIQNLIRKGLSLQQVQAAKPTLEYDPRYGSTSGPWTTDMFIAAVYRSLTQKPKARSGLSLDGEAR
jgi:glyoxylase-like metal-dependent hydrolase (beta-lactamase superfamily II)